MWYCVVMTRMLGIFGVLTVLGCGQSGNVAGERGPVVVNAPARPAPAQSNPIQPRIADAAVRLLPPGARLGEGSTAAGGSELSFVSALSPAQLAAWYRSPERRGDFRVSAELQEGAEQVLSGSARGGGEFTVRIAPDSASGSAAMLLISGQTG